MSRFVSSLFRAPKHLSASLLLISLAACGGGGGGGGGGSAVVSVGPPAAQIWVESLLTVPGVAMRFYGQGADPEGGALTYAWDFDGNGTTDATTQAPSNTFATAGERVVTLTVTDAAGDSSTATITVSVRAAAPGAGVAVPGAGIQAFSLLGDPAFEVHFHAQAFDPDTGAIASFSWDFTDDGTFDAVTATRTTTATYAAAGPQRCRVRITDNDGQTSDATVTITLCDDGSLPTGGPGVQMLVPNTTSGPSTPEPTGSVTGTLTLEAFGSDLDGGAAAAVLWETNQDGLFDDGSGRSMVVPLAVAGSLEVRTRMIDDEGFSSDSLCTLRIDDASGATNEPAGVFIQSQALTVSPGIPVCFFGHVSDDAAGATLSWDFDGDGVEDSTLADPSFTFALPGKYLPELTVTDFGGLVSRAFVTVIVEACVSGGGPPANYFWCDCDDVYIAHGGTAKVVIDCPVQIGSAPSEATVIGKAGPLGIGGDPFGTDIEVKDTAGNVSPPPAAPAPNPGPAPFTITVKSLAVDGGPRTVCYTITLRLRDPGVRVQILKCNVCIAHDYLTCNLDVGGAAPNHVAIVTITPPAPSPGLLPIPPAHSFVIDFNQQDPTWISVNNVQNLPAGWQTVPAGAGVLQILLVDTGLGQPIQPGAPPFLFSLDFVTSGGRTQFGRGLLPR